MTAPEPESGPVYDLRSVTLPRLQGRALEAFAALLENRATRALLQGRMMRDAGVAEMRRLRVDEPPTFTPPVAAENGSGMSDGDGEDPVEVARALARRRRREGATARDYEEAYRSGAATPEQVAERVLAAVAQSDRGPTPLRALIAISREDVLRQAREATRRYAEGRPLGPLDGVPVAVKDEIDQLPYGSTLGTRFLGKTPPREDATVVRRLRAAGALLIGKTNMHEIGIGPFGHNAHHGIARNPFDPGHYSGGSSSGSAAAVAAGLCPAAVGADGGGSIRIPSAFCDLVGLKPTFGRVSTFGGAPLDWTVGHLGPIASTARDAALLYAAVAGPDPRDPATLHQPPVTLDGLGDPDLRGLTLGVFWPWFRHAAPAVVAECERLLRSLERMGARVEEVEIPELEAARVAHLVTITSEMAAAVDRHDASHRREYGPEVRTNLALARMLTARDYVQAQRIRTRTLEHFTRALQRADAIVTPMTGRTAPPIRASALPGGESDIGTALEIMRFATPANFTGLPSISIPAGYDDSGLPVGLQAIGKRWGERTLLRLAYAAEEVVPSRAPEVYFDCLGRGGRA